MATEMKFNGKSLKAKVYASENFMSLFGTDEIEILDFRGIYIKKFSNNINVPCASSNIASENNKSEMEIKHKLFFDGIKKLPVTLNELIIKAEKNIVINKKKNIVKSVIKNISFVCECNTALKYYMTLDDVLLYAQRPVVKVAHRKSRNSNEEGKITTNKNSFIDKEGQTMVCLDCIWTFRVTKWWVLSSSCR